MKRKSKISIVLYVYNFTIGFDLGRDLDLGTVALIDIKQKDVSRSRKTVTVTFR